MPIKCQNYRTQNPARSEDGAGGVNYLKYSKTRKHVKGLLVDNKIQNRRAGDENGEVEIPDFEFFAVDPHTN